MVKSNFSKAALRVAMALLSFLMIAPMSYAQKATVSGKVVDAQNQPLLGVGVVVKGTQMGTVTDIDGNYSIQVANDAVLVFSSIGYATQEIAVGNRGTVNVVLQEDNRLLDEVVVIGYGSARKGDLTSSISSVKGDVISQRGVAQASSALQGQVAGVQVTRSNGDAAGSATIRVHGMTTMSTNDPLVIVDGVPSSLDYIDASDIETISVLKDASAASIYGARAAAGVILVTTKRAKTDQFSLNYSYEYSFDRPTEMLENTGVIDFLNLFNEVRMNDGAGEYSVYSKEYIDTYMANNAKDHIHYPNADWVDMTLKKNTSHQRHSITMTAGSKMVRTNATFNYYTGDGYYEGKSYDKYSGRINNDLHITDWMKATIDLGYYYAKNQDAAFGEIINYAYYLPPIYAPRWENGDYTDVKDGNNILPVLHDGGFKDNNSYSLNANAKLEINPFKGMTISASFAPQYGFTRNKTFQKKVESYYEDGKACPSLMSKSTDLTESRGFSEAYTYQALANYMNTFGDHSINGMVGYEGYTYYNETVTGNRKNYTLTSFPYLNIGPEDFQYNSGDAKHNAYQSVFGRIIYSYKDKYLFQASVRADGSSRFDKRYRVGVFPSVSLGWVMSSEPWFNTNGPVNFLKLRASVGSLGNERIGSDFPYQALMSYGSVTIMNAGNKTPEAVQVARQTDYAYEDITWETTTTYGLGVDANFFDSRLTFNADAYYKKTSGMLLEVGFPTYYGYDSPKANAGDMHTYGYDIEIGWKDTIGDFTYGISANLSDYRSIMGYLGDKKTISGNYLYEKGSYFQEWYMYQADGLVLTDEDTKLPTVGDVNKKGFVKYVNQNDDKVINADDKVKLGNSLPEYLFGGNIFLGYKNWDFSLQFQGIGHQNVLFDTRWIQPIAEQYRSVPVNLMGNYWSVYNTDEQNAKAKYPMATWTYRSNTYAASSFWLFNGGYFRVKNITLGYTLPKKVTDSIKMKGLRVYANIIDLPAISKYPKGIDPEWGMYQQFITTSAVLGVNVKF